MMDVLRRTTLAVRTDPLEDPTPQTVMPWAEVLAFLPHLEALAEAGTTLQLGETPGHVAGIVADVPAAPATAAKAWGRTRQTAWWAWRPRHVSFVPHTPSVTLGGRPYGRPSAP